MVTAYGAPALDRQVLPDGVLFCAVAGETVVRFAWFALPARVGPLTAADIEPTLSHVV